MTGEHQRDNMLALIALIQDWGMDGSKQGQDSSLETLEFDPPSYHTVIALRCSSLSFLSMRYPTNINIPTSSQQPDV